MPMLRKADSSSSATSEKPASTHHKPYPNSEQRQAISAVQNSHNFQKKGLHRELGRQSPKVLSPPLLTTIYTDNVFNVKAKGFDKFQPEVCLYSFPKKYTKDKQNINRSRHG